MTSYQYIRNHIFKWYLQNKRQFPWRSTKNPYKIMIAEFMLHRTKAEQVMPIYNSFIKQFPDIKALTSSKFSIIKKVTKHLGLHWRSKHFIKSVKYIIKNFNGRIPKNINELLKIPGVGKYIAGAILTVCFNKSYPVVDSNIARFINRFYGLNLSGEIRRKKIIINYADSLFNTNKSGKFLFAIIDFTSLVCKPRISDCQNCIINKRCKQKI